MRGFTEVETSGLWQAPDLTDQFSAWQKLQPQEEKAIAVARKHGVLPDGDQKLEARFSSYYDATSDTYRSCSGKILSLADGNVTVFVSATEVGGLLGPEIAPWVWVHQNIPTGANTGLDLTVSYELPDIGDPGRARLEIWEVVDGNVIQSVKILTRTGGDLYVWIATPLASRAWIWSGSANDGSQYYDERSWKLNPVGAVNLATMMRTGQLLAEIQVKSLKEIYQTLAKIVGAS